MVICSPDASNITRRLSPMVILLVEGEQIAMLSSDKDNNCFIIPTVQKRKHVEQWNCTTLCPICLKACLLQSFGFFLYVAVLPGSMLH